MAQFDIPVRVIYQNTVTVEADSEEEARKIVEHPDFTFDSAISFTHDSGPIIEIEDLA